MRFARSISSDGCSSRWRPISFRNSCSASVVASRAAASSSGTAPARGRSRRAARCRGCPAAGRGARGRPRPGRAPVRARRPRRGGCTLLLPTVDQRGDGSCKRVTAGRGHAGICRLRFRGALNAAASARFGGDGAWNPRCTSPGETGFKRTERRRRDPGEPDGAVATAERQDGSPPMASRAQREDAGAASARAAARAPPRRPRSPPRASASTTSSAASTGARASSAGSSRSVSPRCSPRSLVAAGAAIGLTGDGSRGDRRAPRSSASAAASRCSSCSCSPTTRAGTSPAACRASTAAARASGRWAIGLIVTVGAGASRRSCSATSTTCSSSSTCPRSPSRRASRSRRGGAITLAISIVATVLAAVAGGKAGERYHRRVDRAGFVD